jgi:integrase
MSRLTEVLPRRNRSVSLNSSEQRGTGQNTKSVQKVSKQNTKPAGRYAKTDVRYWEKAIFQPTYTRAGKTRIVGEWVAKIQHLGQRETFSLGSANKTAAASRAKEIFLSLQSSGWGATLANYKPKAEVKVRSVATIGEFLAEVKMNASGRAKTTEGYCRAFRSIVADIFNIDGGKAKYDYRTGGREQWLSQVERVKLADVTPEAVLKWKLRYIRRAGNDPLKQRAARISVNSIMRQAKSLFAPAVMKFITLEVPDALPFEGVSFEPRQSMRYRGGFIVEDVISAAKSELTSEPMKIFLLAVMAGLRRNEIDKLEWAAFRWKQGVIRIEATRFFQPKSEDSTGDVEVDPELMEVFRGFRASAKGDFVIESKNAARPEATYAHYRCERDFAALTKWLRQHGVEGKTPLHSLRKEFGSQICAKHGIYAASNALRHADIAITSQHYLDKKRRVTLGMGHLLADTENVIPMNTTAVQKHLPLVRNSGTKRGGDK